MAGTINKVIVVGRLGKDPDVKTLQSGGRVANLSVATDEGYKKKDGTKVDKTEWHRVTVWGDGLCGVIERYCTKGDLVGIEGKLETRKWQDNDGNDRYSTDIVISGFNGSFTMLGGSGGERPATGASDQGKYDPGANNADEDLGSGDGGLDDEIPF